MLGIPEFIRRTIGLESPVEEDEPVAAVERRGAADPKAAEHARRRAIRHNCEVAIRMLIGYAIAGSDTWGSDALKIKGRLLDLSAGGASLFTKQGFDAGQILQLAIKLPGGAEIRTNATIRWVKPWPDKGGHVSGVQFDKPSSRDQQMIVKFLKELDAALAGE